MSTNNDLTEVLNDLIQINNDRYEGYQKAIKDVENIDVDLKGIFTKMAEQSQECKTKLVAEVSKLGGEVAEGTTASGKIHRAWIDLKATFSGKDRQAALDSCEFGEDATQRAYKEALASDADMNTETRQLITTQKEELKKSHDTIRAMRDANKAAS